MAVAKANTIVTGDVNLTVREIDFVSRFSTDLSALLDLLQISEGIKKEAGTNLVTRTVSIDLAETVAEGEVIPYSEASFTETPAAPLVWDKHQLGVTMEMIGKYGYNLAVEKVDQALLGKLRTNIINNFYSVLEQGTLEETAKGIQAKLAKAKAEVFKHFEQISLGTTGSVAWVNSDEFYEWLGEKEITVQTAFGLSYVQNYLGFDVIFLTSFITYGTVVATALNNLNVYYIDPSDSDYAKAGLEFTTDETGFIGVHIGGKYETVVSETTTVSGVTLMPEFMDGIAVITETP